MEEANASRLAALAAEGSRLPIDGFEGDELTEALMAVSDAVRNVEVHGIEDKVREALAQVDRGLERAEARGHRASAILVELVHRKFATLASSPVWPHASLPALSRLRLPVHPAFHHRLEGFRWWIILESSGASRRLASHRGIV